MIQTNIVTHTIDLNVSQPNNFEYVYTTQGDYGSDKIIANLYDQNVPYEIDCDMIFLQGVTQYGDLIEINKGLEISKDRHSVTFTLTKDMLSSAGDIQYTLSFIDTTGRCKKTTFPFTIKNTIEPSGTISSSTLTAITDYVLEAKQYAEDAKQSYDDLVSEKGKMNGIASLDENGKVPLDQLPDASTTQKGIVQLTDSTSSTSTTTAATPNSVNLVKDSLNSEINRATSAENTLTTNLNSEISRAKSAEATLETNLSDEVTRAKGAENTNATAISAETSRATTKENEIANNLSAEITRAKNSEALKAPLASPALTGTPTAPTASAGTNTTQIATTAFTQTAVSNHNSSTTAHTDIRDLIAGLTTRLNALADSDDTTLDQLSEIVAYIKSNRTLIENVTTNKVNVADIVDNLTSTATNKPLSAKQGKVLNDLITTLKNTVNTKVDKVSGKGLSTNDLTDSLKGNYDTAYTHSQSTHARTDATKVEKSSTNGNIKINGTETTVYTHPSGTNPHGTTKSDVGLGNVGNFKAVSTVASQGLSDAEKSNARSNIGAGTSSFSGSYNDLTNKPTIPTNNNQLTNGAGYITSSGTAKTISDTLPISKGGTGQTTGVDAANALINSLDTGSETPTDKDYYVSQYVGGGTTKTTYHRRPMSALWNYIKSKLANVATSGNYNDLSNKPTIPSVGNGTVTIKQAGTSKGTFTMNQSGNTTIELTDNNTWRGIQNNLTSDSTTDSLSAAQGKVLNDTKVGFANVTASEIAKTNNKPYFGNVQDEDIGIGNGLYYNVINFGSYSQGNFRSQIAMPYQNNITDSDMYIRTDNGGTWRAWRKIIHSGNIGSQNVNIANKSNLTTAVLDYNEPSRDIQIGYAGAGLTTDNLSHIAGYTDNGYKIKDVSKDVLKSWLGLATKEHNGLMSAEDKTVIENFKSGGVTGVKGANETSYRSGNVSLSVDDIGAAAKEQIGDHTVKTNVPENAVFTDTTYGVVTEKTNGLMSSTDKKNLEDLLDPYNRNMLADGTDFHKVTKPGSYQFHHTKTYINNPPMVNGFVDVKTYGNIVKQIAYRQGTIGTNDHEIYECTGNKANDDWSDWVRILTTKDACGYVGGAAKASASYKLNTSHAYLIIGTGHAPSTSIDSLSCGEYIYYDNSKWNRMQIFASSFPASAMGITGNTLIVGYNSQKEASSCDRHILLRVK